MNRITNFINQFSFSRKLAISFFICSVLTFAVIDVILHVLYSTVVTSTKEDSGFNTQAFSQFSNFQTLSSAQSYFHSGVNIYEDIISLLFNTYDHFYQSPQLYISKQSKGENPDLAQTFQNPKYDRSCIYFFTQNSTFYNHPFLDKAIASSATNHYPSKLKRISIIYQSQTDPTDISVRTMPATKDFFIPNTDVISKRFENLTRGIITSTNVYFDSFSKSSNTTSLVAVRMMVPNTTGFNMLIQVQLYSDIVDHALSQIYSFPSTKVALLRSNSEQNFFMMGKNSQLPPYINLSNFIEDGSKNATIEDQQYLITTKTYVEQNSILAPSNIDSANLPNNKMIIFLNKSQAQLPNIIYMNFLAQEYYTLVFILYGWTFIVLVIIFSISFVVGDIIFSYFSQIRKKLKQYLQNPGQLQLIISEMRQKFKNSSQSRVVFENIVQIMQNIENKKQQNRKNFKISSDCYPLNRMGVQFQQKMRIRDYNKLQSIGRLIKQREYYIK